MTLEKMDSYSIILFTAAHCFFDEGLGMAVNSTTDYKIVVSKYTRDYKKNDNAFQKEYEVRFCLSAFS